MQKNILFYIGFIVLLLEDGEGGRRLLGGDGSRSKGSLTTKSITDQYDPNEPICHRRHGVFVPMRGSCSGYFACIDGNAIAGSCGSFYRFNRLTRHCDHPTHVDCDPNELLLDPWHDQFEPTEATKLTSIEDPLTGFSQRIPKPHSLHEVFADTKGGDICNMKRNGELLSKLDSCTQYYVCLLQRPYIRTCPPMLHFNAKRGLCQAPALAECVNSNRSAHSTAELELIKLHGATCDDMPDGMLLPHSDNCMKYYNCQSKQRTGMECPDGLHFSVRHQRCEWPILARCSL